MQKDITIPYFTSDVSVTACGAWQYTATNTIGGTAIDSSLFTFFYDTSQVILSVQSTDPLKAGTYQIRV